MPVLLCALEIKNMVDAKFEVERRLREGEWDLSLQRKKAGKNKERSIEFIISPLQVKATHESEF